MKLLVDMCLSPYLAQDLVEAGHDAIHWSTIGDPSADDAKIMEWAASNGHVVITHDLDFGDLLFLSKDAGPSVVIIREKNIAPA